jgi:hypothetical protein
MFDMTTMIKEKKESLVSSLSYNDFNDEKAVFIELELS